MRLLISILLFMHGLIHIMGFTKGFNLAPVQGLSGEISRVQGIFWLLASLLLIVGTWMYLNGSNHWQWIMLAGMILSMIMIVTSWTDARFGTILNGLIIFILVAGFSSCSMQKAAIKETEALLHHTKNTEPRTITAEEIQHLPSPVQLWLQNSGMVGKQEILSAKATQESILRMKPEQTDWYPAESVQYVTTRVPGFVWTVKVKMSSIIKIKGRDKYINGRGAMKVKVNSLINAVNETGDKLDEGTLQRFLGELVWYPSMALSPLISWELLDTQRARATMTYEGVTGSGVFTFSENGDFVEFETMRYKGNSPEAQRYPWVITADEYAVFDGIRVPVSMQAIWKLDEGDWTWLKMKVTHIEYNLEDQPIENNL